ncbi:MAG: hypothetical protein AVDCRST_MAG11-1609 [uncultured Gemmatimonadaceae bacterium]|uniref:Uncharacterized protein n=1 Tax=uncultured Gemmatimonadaceae bacterium TaxID=246130 RepID=A0A6J4KSK8_9BACT|nr:MAG: hypothetical protein AVDCRST_MAG11-1609 [uncultured Gemmatimonadaceae bacterium]
MSAPHSDAPPTPGSRFTRLLFAIALGLGVVVLGVRLVRGVRTGYVDWLEMALPTAVLLGLGGIVAGPRRPWLYYPLLVAGFALLVAFYALPHRVRPTSRPAAPAPAAAAPAAR